MTFVNRPSSFGRGNGLSNVGPQIQTDGNETEKEEIFFHALEVMKRRENMKVEELILRTDLSLIFAVMMGDDDSSKRK